MKRLIAVDVDGVLNRFDGLPEPPAGWRDEVVTLNGRRFRIRHNPGHGAQLLALAQETDAELVWLTTWEADASTHIAPLVGLPELPHVPMAPGLAGLKFSEYRHPGKVKAMAMEAYAAPGQEFAWFDDDANPGDLYWPAPHLVVQVDPAVGLTDEDIARAREWLQSRRKIEPS